MEKSITHESLEAQFDKTKEINEKLEDVLDKYFEILEISIKPSLACNYGSGSSECDKGTCN